MKSLRCHLEVIFVALNFVVIQSRASTDYRGEKIHGWKFS